MPRLKGLNILRLLMVTIVLSIVTKVSKYVPAPDGQTRKIPHCFDLYFFE